MPKGYPHPYWWNKSKNNYIKGAANSSEPIDTEKDIHKNSGKPYSVAGSNKKSKSVNRKNKWKGNNLDMKNIFSDDDSKIINTKSIKTNPNHMRIRWENTLITSNDSKTLLPSTKYHPSPNIRLPSKNYKNLDYLHVGTSTIKKKPLLVKSDKFDPIALINRQARYGFLPIPEINKVTPYQESDSVKPDKKFVLNIISQKIITGQIKNKSDLEIEKKKLCLKHKILVFKNVEILKNIDKKYLVNFK